MPLSIVLGIDVEPDEQVSGPEDAWTGARLARQELTRLRLRLEQATGAQVRFNWFLRFDPQIERNWGRRDWVAGACGDLLADIRRSGDFTGIHVHTWKWHEKRQTWFNEFADASWRAHCLETSVEAYREMFGNGPAASRFGHRSIWHEDIPVLMRMGVRYDLTLEPGAPSHRLSADPLATASLPGYIRAPRVPYRASARDYLSPAKEHDDSGLWMIPLSVTRRRHWHPLRCSPFLLRQPLPMNLALRPRQVWRHLSIELGLQPGEPSPPLVTILRSGDLAFPRYYDNFRYVMDRMCTHPGLRQCRFVGVDRAMDRYTQAQTHAGTA
jgi:hypothetical protein